MKRTLRICLVATLLIVLFAGNAAVAAAMSPEDQQAYNEWYLARFGRLPGQEPAPVNPSPQPQPSDPGGTISDDDKAAYDAWYEARFGSRPQNPSTGYSPAPPAKIQPAEPTAFERQVVELLNQERVKRGLRPVEIDPYLVQAARIKGQDMVRYGYYGHQSPTYGYSSGLLAALGISCRQSRENLCVAGTPLMAHESWMSSPSHRDNMLKPFWTHVGVGVVSRETGSSMYGYYVVEIFIQR